MFSLNAEHRNPVLSAFLRFIEKDFLEEQGMRELPASVAAAVKRALKTRLRFDEMLDGDVVL